MLGAASPFAVRAIEYSEAVLHLESLVQDVNRAPADTTREDPGLGHSSGAWLVFWLSYLIKLGLSNLVVPSGGRFVINLREDGFRSV